MLFEFPLKIHHIKQHVYIMYEYVYEYQNKRHTEHFAAYTQSKRLLINNHSKKLKYHRAQRTNKKKKKTISYGRTVKHTTACLSLMAEIMEFNAEKQPRNPVDSSIAALLSFTLIHSHYCFSTLLHSTYNTCYVFHFPYPRLRIFMLMEKILSLRT